MTGHQEKCCARRTRPQRGWVGSRSWRYRNRLSELPLDPFGTLKPSVIGRRKLVCVARQIQQCRIVVTGKPRRRESLRWCRLGLSSQAGFHQGWVNGRKLSRVKNGTRPPQKRDATSVHGGGGGRNHDSAMAGALGVATKPSFSPCDGCPGPRDEVVFLEWKHWIRATSG
jgi:hypothetical protein